MKLHNSIKRYLGIDKLEKRVNKLEKQVKTTLYRAQMNNLRTLMMLEHGDFPTLDGRVNDKEEKL